MCYCFVYQNGCTCLHQTVKKDSFLFKNNENTQKRQHSCTCTELSLKRKEGMLKSPQITNTHRFGNLEKSDHEKWIRCYTKKCPKTV